jgi:hypothetical protein
MPVQVSKKDGGYQVKTPNMVHAKKTTKKKAEAQARLLRALDHGWKPSDGFSPEVVKKVAKKHA